MSFNPPSLYQLFLGASGGSALSIAVALLAIVVTTANASFLTLDLPPVLSVVAAVLVVIFGADLTRRAWRARSGAHDHDHGHEHGAAAHGAAGHGHPDHAHSGIELSRGYTMSVGIVGGLVPNATALIVLIMAINFQEIAIGILLVIAFGLGIATLLIAIGVAAILVGRRGGGLAAGDGRLSRAIAWLPLASALAVLAVSLALTVRAVWMP